MNVSALIPVKGFRNAKQRLSEVLGPDDREVLAESMFRDVLREVLLAQGLCETIVVTGDSHVKDISKSMGAEVLFENAETGETEAVDFARCQLKNSGREAVLILPGDMPLARAADIEAVLSQIPDGQGAPFALLVPSHDRLGTNGLLLAPPDVITLRFGYDSFSYHLSQVSAQGLPIRFFENRHIALDIDEPRDLEQFLACGSEASEAFVTARRLLVKSRSHQIGRAGSA